MVGVVKRTEGGGFELGGWMVWRSKGWNIGDEQVARGVGVVEVQVEVPIDIRMT